MINVDKQIAHWREGAEEDWSVAQELIERGRRRHGLFFAHLALEKILKAHCCRTSKELAPFIHNLVRLAAISGVDFHEQQIDLLAEVNEFNIEGRYPELLVPVPTEVEVQSYVADSRGV